MTCCVFDAGDFKTAQEVQTLLIKYKERANRARRALLNEKTKFGFISDGSGKRYRVHIDYMLSDELNSAEEFVQWFEQEFPDDSGEPAFLLFAATMYFRLAVLAKARRYLMDAMLSNIYLLPFIVGKPIQPLDIWHSSNWQMPQYLQDINELLEHISGPDRDWISDQYIQLPFDAARTKYIATFTALQNQYDVQVRKKLLNDWYDYRERIYKSL